VVKVLSGSSCTSDITEYTQRNHKNEEDKYPPTDLNLKPGEYWAIGDDVNGCERECSKLTNCDAFIRYQGDACYLFKLNDTDKEKTSQSFSGTPVESKCYIK
jgi:hypothetical protein